MQQLSNTTARAQEINGVRRTGKT